MLQILKAKHVFFESVKKRCADMCAVLFRIHLDEIDEMGRFSFGHWGKNTVGKTPAKHIFEQLKKNMLFSMIQQNHDS